MALKVMILYFYGASNAKKNVFHGFGNMVNWLWERVGKVFDIFLKEIVLTLTHICGFFCTQENTIVNTTDYENTKYLHMRAYA